jgi:hypothetical protein
MSEIIIPTWDQGAYTETTFSSKEDWREYVLTLFKEPGQYNFNELSEVFNEEARKFNKNGYYCGSPLNQKILWLIGIGRNLIVQMGCCIKMGGMFGICPEIIICGLTSSQSLIKKRINLDLLKLEMLSITWHSMNC